MTPPAFPEPSTPTQVAHSGKAVIRTVIQTGAGLAAAIPIVVTMSGADRNIAAVATALTVSAIFTKVMAIPEVNALLSRWGLGATPKNGA
jgi:hypothetical protein